MQLDKKYIADILGISKEELEKLIKEKQKEYYGFLDENTAITLILKERGFNIEDLLNIKVKNLQSGMKVKSINLYINKILHKKENLIILECLDETGKIKVIFKGDYKKIEDILKEGNFIKVDGIVLKNKTLAIFTNNINNIKKSDEKFEVKETYYVIEFIGKVLRKLEDSYEILTEKFNIIYAKYPFNLEENKNYLFKGYLKKPIEIFYASEINNLS